MIKYYMFIVLVCLLANLEAQEKAELHFQKSLLHYWQDRDLLSWMEIEQACAIEIKPCYLIQKAKILYSGAGIFKNVSLAKSLVQNNFQKLLQDSSNSHSLYLAGWIYSNGHKFGLKTDRDKAYEYYLKAAKLQHAQSMHNLGNILLGKARQNKNYKPALEWYRKAVALKSGRAMKTLGDLYKRGEGVEKNYLRAQEYYSSARELQFTEGATSLATIYSETKSTKKAYELYSEAAKLGNVKAMIKLAQLHEKKPTKNAIKSQHYYLQAAQIGNGDAMLKLSQIYYNKQLWLKAAKWAHLAAQSGNANAMYKLGQMYEEGQGIIQSYNKAIKWYQKAAKLKHLNAMLSLGDLYLYGSENLPQNTKQAVYWYKKANKKSAMISLGDIYRKGFGTKKSFAKAKKWYTKAKLKANDKRFKLLKARK